MGEEERGPRVVAGVSGSPGSLAALRRAAAEARRGGAELLVVIAWEAPGGDFAHRSALSPLPMATLRLDAGRRLLAAPATAFGDAGPGSRTRALSFGAHRGGRWSRPPTGPTTCWWSARDVGFTSAARLGTDQA
ncbi:universal stress protein [Streptomyces mirabilis]|uniref:universal stress protein n=1 Tax=Streptomyces mirabilis TaxID=68239 RepID=UPI0036B92469